MTRRLLLCLSVVVLLAGCGAAATSPPSPTTIATAAPAEAGATPAPTLPAVMPPVGPAFVCPPGSTPDTPGPVAQARPPHDPPTAVAFDRSAGGLVALADAGDGLETWTFDVCANTWTRMHPNREPAGIDELDLFVYDVDSDLTIALDRDTASVWAYDLRANTWTRKGDGPPDARAGYYSAISRLDDARLGAYDPRSGLVVAAVKSDPSDESMALWSYVVETDTWAPIHDAPWPPLGVFAYDTSVDRLVVYTAAGNNRPAEVWLLDIGAGTWSKSGAETPAVAGWLAGPAIAYDEAAERTVVFNRVPWAAYDAGADRWEVLADADPGGAFPSSMVYDSVNRRLVGLRGDDVLAFDTRTREWTVLLEARTGQPAAAAPSVGPAFACPPGSTPDEPGPVAQARPPAGPMVFDRDSGRIVLVGQPEDGGTETWTFDVCTNAWAQMHPNQEPGLGMLVYDVDSEVTIGYDLRRVWVYDLEADTWTEKGPFAPLEGLPSLGWFRFYDPVSGLVVAVADDRGSTILGPEMWSYEVETGTWTPIPQASRPAIGPHDEDFAYDASLDRLVVYTSAEDGSTRFEAKTWLFDLRSGTWSETDAVTPEFIFAGWGNYPAIAYDEAAERTVMVGQGHSAAYDAAADRWETLSSWTSSEDWLTVACGTRPECRQDLGMVYDPVNERLVVYGGTAIPGAGWESGTPVDDVLAFDTRTREWTVLLAPSESVTP
jgi:hypothetical protein